MRSRYSPNDLRRACSGGFGDLVDDLLEEDDAEVNAAGYVGQELDDEVFDGRAGQIGNGVGEGREPDCSPPLRP